jgi:hypothetical protein
VEVEDEALVGTLAYLRNSATPPWSPAHERRYCIAGTGPYRLIEDGREPADLADPQDVLLDLYRRCYGRAAELMSDAGWVCIHGALATVGGTRVLLTGPKAVGKTTLALRLLFDGLAVEGDERVYVRDGAAVALPRRFHCKPGATELVPELASWWDDLPVITAPTTDGQRTIAAFDPTVAGLPWTLLDGPLDASVLLAGPAVDVTRPTVRPVATGTAFPRVTSEVFGQPGSESATIAAAVASVIRSGPTFELERGTPEATAAALRGALA